MELFERYPTLRIVLQEMCQRVGISIDEVDFKKENWFSEYIWTPKEEEDFQRWLVMYLRENAQARRELLRFSSLKNKDYLNKVAHNFLFQYGWATNYDEAQTPTEENDITILGHDEQCSKIWGVTPCDCWVTVEYKKKHSTKQ